MKTFHFVKCVVHSLPQPTRHKVGRTCTSGCISRQCNKDSAKKSVQKGKVFIASHADFSCRPVVGGTRTETAKCKEETALAFESMQKLHKNKNAMTSVIMRPCYVLLKDLSLELKEKHECCLIQPNVKKLPQKMESKTDFIKKPKVILHDTIKKCSIERLKKPLQMQNAEMLLDDAKENQREDSMEPNNFAKTLCSGGADSRETNVDYDGQKENKASSPDNDTFCDVGIFEKLAAMGFSDVDSIMDPGDIQENGKGSFQVDPVLIPKARVSLSRMGASFSLPDEADLCEAACELESCFASLRSGEDLKLDAGTVPSKTQIKVPTELGSTNSLMEGGVQNQVERLSPSSPSEDSCWLLVGIDDIVEVADPDQDMSREQDCGDVPLSHGVGLPQLEGESDCGSCPDGAAVRIEKGTRVSAHNEAWDGEIGCSEGSGSRLVLWGSCY